MNKVLITGCGPAGMMAALAAARAGAQVTILEGMDRPGKKLLLTGNGKCNLTSLDPELARRYYGAEKSVAAVLNQFSVSDTLDFFHSIGLITAVKNNGVYPYTGQSLSVLELLLAELNRLGIKLKFSEKITHISKEGNAITVHTDTWQYSADRVILACGSKAVPVTGSDGSGYQLAREAGHRIVPVLPALTALCVKEKWTASCAGVRAQAAVSIYPGGQLVPDQASVVEKAESGSTMQSAAKQMTDRVFCETGELQWTEYGISGIVVFQLSRFASIALQQKETIPVRVDLFPQMTAAELSVWLTQIKNKSAQIQTATALAGILPKKLLLALLEQQGIRPKEKMEQVTEKQLNRLAVFLKNVVLTVKGTKSFDQCQICTGGVSMKEIVPETLESKIMPGLYFAGEMLDVDGPCGGYNLQWAWSSGWVAGYHAGSEEKTGEQ